MLVEIFVDDTLFIGTDELCKEFLEEMNKEFEISMFSEIKFFVGLQVYQVKHGIKITQSKYIKEILVFWDGRLKNIHHTHGYRT